VLSSIFLGDSLATYNFADSNKFKTIVVFDCRGVEPVEFSPRNGWKVIELERKLRGSPKKGFRERKKSRMTQAVITS
jgi:hypothetical protein